MKETTIRKRLEYWESMLDKLMKAYEELISGGVKSYMIDDRQLTKFDLPELKREIESAEAKVDALTAQLSGGGSRKAFGIVPMDW